MSIYKNTHNLLENSLKIGSAIFLVIGASLIIPNAVAAFNSNHPVPKNVIPAVQDSTSKRGQDSEGGTGYKPPSNFGRPLSNFSSGTR